MTIKHEEYLGDGAYVRLHAPDEVELYTSNGLTVENRVFLDRHALRVFERWLARVREADGKRLAEGQI